MEASYKCSSTNPEDSLSEIVDRLKAFVEYAKPLGDEKGEAQVFCDRLFQAFGHAGYKEAGATLEARVPKKGLKGKKYVDLIWKPHLLLEMKSAGEKLHRFHASKLNGSYFNCLWQCLQRTLTYCHQRPLKASLMTVLNTGSPRMTYSGGCSIR
jgi:hypothetical protein